MKIKVNMTRESVKAYDKTKFEVEIEEFDFAWKCKFTEKQLEDIKDNCISKIEKRKPYLHIIHEEVFRKMKPRMPKTESFDPEMVRNTNEVIEAISDKLRETMDLDSYKPTQQGLEMPDDRSDAE